MVCSDNKSANFIPGNVKGENLKVTDYSGKGNTTNAPDSKAGGKSEVSGVTGSEQNGVTN